MIARSPSSIVSDFATRQFSRQHTRIRFLAGCIRSLVPIDSFQRKAICPAGYMYMPCRGTIPSGVPNFVIYPRAAALRNVCGQGAAILHVRGASVTSALCPRNNRCIIRFQSGLGVICIDLLSSHRLFGNCGHVRNALRRARLASRVYTRSLYVWLTYQSRDLRVSCTTGGNVKRSRPRSSQLSRYYLFKGRRA